MWMLFLLSFINFCLASNLQWSFLCFSFFLPFWPFPWQWQPFWKNQTFYAQLHMAYIPTRFHKDWSRHLWEIERTKIRDFSLRGQGVVKAWQGDFQQLHRDMFPQKFVVSSHHLKNLHFKCAFANILLISFIFNFKFMFCTCIIVVEEWAFAETILKQYSCFRLLLRKNKTFTFKLFLQ